MKKVFEKQPKKYLDRIGDDLHDRIMQGIDGLEEWEGDIKKMKGYTDLYRLGVGDYRVNFALKNEVLTIITIGPRGRGLQKLGGIIVDKELMKKIAATEEIEPDETDIAMMAEAKSEGISLNQYVTTALAYYTGRQTSRN